jgi:soluble cytochrome b562
MQTERVTYLTTAEQKAALEAFAKARGESVGNVLREASSRYLSEADMTEVERFKLLIDELDDALPHMHSALNRAIEGQQKLRADIDSMLREAGLRK